MSPPFGLLIASEPPSRRVGVLVALAAVALSTLIVYPLKQVAPVASLSVVYLPAVLVVSVTWGAWLGFATALVSAAAFNFFHLPPVGTFTISNSSNWVALAAFVVVAALSSSVAEVTRARARDAEERRSEADLAAEMARLLLRGASLSEDLPTAAARLAQALKLNSARIEMEAVEGDERTVAFPLREGTRRLGTLLVGADSSEETRRLSRLVDNLLDLSRLQAGAAEPRRDWTSVEELIRTALRELAAGEGDFSLSIERDLPLVRVDPAQMERAFVNVLENARRHSGGQTAPVGARAVRSLARAPGRAATAGSDDGGAASAAAEPSLEGQRPAGDRVIVRIVDRGPGIPPAQLERVFEPFYRAGTAAGGHRGSGLGLAIARGFTEANAGSLHVESLPGQGATFVFGLPLQEPDEESRQDGDSAASTAHVAGSGEPLAGRASAR